MESTIWTIKGSKADLESLLGELRALEAQQHKNSGFLPEGTQPAAAPRDPDAPLGQIEWFQIIISIGTSVASRALYDVAKETIRHFVASRPNKASFKEEVKDDPTENIKQDAKE